MPGDTANGNRSIAVSRDCPEQAYNVETDLLCFRYAQLSASGEYERLRASKDYAAVEAFDEQEMREAVRELERSTAAIQKQTEVLKLQHGAFAKLARENRRAVEARKVAVEGQQRRWESERAGVQAEVCL